MELDDLKEQWKSEINMEAQIADFDVIRRNAKKYDRQAQFSWMLEVFVCAAMGVLLTFGWFNERESNLVMQIGFGWGLLACAFVAWKILHDRRTNTDDDWSLASALNRQIEQRQKEAKLLKTAVFWYLSPIFIFVVLLSYGGDIEKTGSYVPSSFLWIYWAIVVGAYTGIYFHHQRHVDKKIRPLLAQLLDIKKQLES